MQKLARVLTWGINACYSPFAFSNGEIKGWVVHTDNLAPSLPCAWVGELGSVHDVIFSCGKEGAPCWLCFTLLFSWSWRNEEDGEEESVAHGNQQTHDNLYRVHMPSLYSCGSSYGSEASIPAAAHTVSNAPVTEYMWVSHTEPVALCRYPTRILHDLDTASGLAGSGSHTAHATRARRHMPLLKVTMLWCRIDLILLVEVNWLPVSKTRQVFQSQKCMQYNPPRFAFCRYIQKDLNHGVVKCCLISKIVTLNALKESL